MFNFFVKVVRDSYVFFLPEGGQRCLCTLVYAWCACLTSSVCKVRPYVIYL